MIRSGHVSGFATLLVLFLLARCVMTGTAEETNFRLVISFSSVANGPIDSDLEQMKALITRFEASRKLKDSDLN